MQSAKLLHLFPVTHRNTSQIRWGAANILLIYSDTISPSPTLQNKYNIYMPNYIRNKTPGASYFFTLVTYQRRMIFNSKEARDILRKAFQYAKAKNGEFKIDAICLLPNHIHCIWTLLENDFDYSTKWKTIKSYFSHNYLKVGGARGIVSVSKQKKGELGIWQRRFWEHTLTNEKDFQTHFDYIHFNPVKHGLVTKVQDWPWSSFHHYANIGVYDSGWEDMDFDDEIDFGE